ncbi:MAG: DEAD/DEAH box helicase [Deltaproteobacteria bacterium]|jgi:ATP-dependent RNA helicase RhlE|nr:DEAD/DEAH box helicase [Deltaproteobacteria bacterium]
MNLPSTFSELALSAAIQRAITETGYETPTPIQQQAIPPLLEARDLIGCAQTGTGKTAAFALPILQRLTANPKLLSPKRTRTLILTPTRELAIQIHESFRTYGKYLKIKTAVIFGGVGQGPQVSAMRGGVDVLIATPGRLLDLLEQNHLTLQGIEIFVLDEADRMLDMGFIQPIRRVIKMLPMRRQNLFFSATMPPAIQELANSMLVDPIMVSVTPVSSTAERIEQVLMTVAKDKKRDLLKHVLKNPAFKKVIVFTRTKHGANKVSETLEKAGISSEAIHGNKSQTARQRALENFRHGRTRVLIATDLAARGIDVDNITHVINFEIPNVAETYVHRIGRTARAGTEGIAISFCDHEERSYIRDIEKLIGQEIPLDADQPFHANLGSGTPRPPKNGNRNEQPQSPYSRGGGNNRSGRRPQGGRSNSAGPRPNGQGGGRPASSGGSASGGTSNDGARSGGPSRRPQRGAGPRPAGSGSGPRPAGRPNSNRR